MKNNAFDIAFFGSSLVSAYWNGAATYYRGILRALARRGHQITFFEPDAYDRQRHRDIHDPAWAKVVVYPATIDGVHRSLEMARRASLIVKASGVGVFDAELERDILSLKDAGKVVAFWDVDAPATLAMVQDGSKEDFRHLIPSYDIVFTYGGGPKVVAAYRAFGAENCVPIYNGLDPSTHHPVAKSPKFESSCSFLGNRLPDREQRVCSFFFDAAKRLPGHPMVLGGAGWSAADIPENIRYVGHVYTNEHNTFNTSALTVLNINRESMANYGYSPATRVFEAAGAGACVITDVWDGISEFFEPDEEILLARSGEEVAEYVGSLDPRRAREIGRQARRRALAAHTYENRAVEVEHALGIPSRPRGSKGSSHLDIVFLGLSITSSWGNGHATTYRGLARALAGRGHRVTFLEREVPWYAANRDVLEAPYCEIALYGSRHALRDQFSSKIRNADVVIIGSFVPEGIEVATWVLETARGIVAFYDIDTPVTVAELERDNCPYLSRALIPEYDLYLSFTGGPMLERIERHFGAQRALPLYCSVDPELYRPDPRATKTWCLGYMGTYSPDRQASLERLFVSCAKVLPNKRFVVAGAQYPSGVFWPENVRHLSHLAPSAHAGFYNALEFALNLTRKDMIAAGYSPSVRLFEAGLCGTPLITDRWPGIEAFFEPDDEILVVDDQREVVQILLNATEAQRTAMGGRARERILAEHTPEARAIALETYLDGSVAKNLNLNVA